MFKNLKKWLTFKSLSKEDKDRLQKAEEKRQRKNANRLNWAGTKKEMQ